MASPLERSSARRAFWERVGCESGWDFFLEFVVQLWMVWVVLAGLALALVAHFG